jgi:hypothetical protein
VSHSLLVAALDEEHFATKLIESLADAAGISMTKDPDEAWDQPSRPTIPTGELRA